MQWLFKQLCIHSFAVVHTEDRQVIIHYRLDLLISILQTKICLEYVLSRTESIHSWAVTCWAFNETFSHCYCCCWNLGVFLHCLSTVCTIIPLHVVHVYNVSQKSMALCNTDLVENLLLSPAVKEFWKSVNIYQSYA